jgi:hypothetical protein
MGRSVTSPISLRGLPVMARGIKWSTWLLTIGVFAWGCSAKIDESANVPPSGTARSKQALLPQAAVQTFLDGLKASKPVVVWDLLSSQQQEAINELVQRFAEEIDPDVWAETVQTLKKLARVLETKKDFILQNAMWRAAGVKVEAVKAGWEPAVQILNSLLNSELIDAERMKKFDGRAFLETTGPTLCTQMHAFLRALKSDQLRKLEECEVSLGNRDDFSATVVLQPLDPKAKPINLELTNDQGKWTSTQLSMVVAYLLNKKLPQYHKLFKPYFLADWKDGYLADLKRVEKAFDQLAAAKTSADFDAVVVRDVIPVALQRIVQFRHGLPTYHGLKAVSYNRKATTALVLIKGKHAPDDPDIGAAVARFDQSTPRPAMISTPRTVDGTTVVLVDPVNDLEALARTIDKGRVTQIDVKRKTLTIELPQLAESDRGTVATGRSANSRSTGK